MEEFSSYDVLPWRFTLVPSSGTGMRQIADYVTDYWSEFGSDSEYRVYVESDDLIPALTTASGNKIVGGHSRIGAGLLVVLPMLQDYDESFTEEVEDQEGNIEEFWTRKAVRYGHRLIGALISIDTALRSQAEATPPP